MGTNMGFHASDTEAEIEKCEDETDFEAFKGLVMSSDHCAELLSSFTSGEPTDANGECSSSALGPTCPPATRIDTGSGCHVESPQTRHDCGAVLLSGYCS